MDRDRPDGADRDRRGAINNRRRCEDARGNLYIVDLDGDVFRLTPNVRRRIWAMI